MIICKYVSLCLVDVCLTQAKGSKVLTMCYLETGMFLLTLAFYYLQVILMLAGGYYTTQGVFLFNIDYLIKNSGLGLLSSHHVSFKYWNLFFDFNSLFKRLIICRLYYCSCCKKLLLFIIIRTIVNLIRFQVMDSCKDHGISPCSIWILKSFFWLQLISLWAFDFFQVLN